MTDPDGKPTGCTIEKHKYRCVFLDGEIVRQGRYARLEEALAAAAKRMKRVHPPTRGLK